MQEKAKNFSDDANAIKKELFEALEQIDVLQKQSMNLFDQPKIYNRVFQLLDILDAKFHDLNHFFETPDPDTNRILQDLFFNSTKMRETLENLKLDCHKLEFQQAFIGEIENIKENLNKL